MSQLICDPKRLAAFVDGDLSSDAERELTRHLHQCASCGAELERRVADEAVWEEATKLLGGADSLPSSDRFGSEVDGRFDSQVEQVLAHLAPTDDPNSFGRIGGYEVAGVIGSGGSRRSPWPRRILATAMALLLFAGVLIFLESGKGTIRIESNSEASVPIRIVDGERCVEELTVSKEGITTRLRAGTYHIEVDDESASIEILGDRVTLKRGATWLAKIEVQNKPPKWATSANPTSASPAPKLDAPAKQVNPELADDSKTVLTWDAESGQNVRWRMPLGSQTMRAAVVDDKHVYIGTNNAHGYLARYPSHVDLGVLLCFRKPDGKFLWQHSNEKLSTGRVHDWPLQGVTSRPCVEGDRLWYVTNRCEIVCLDTMGFHDDRNDGPEQNEAFTDDKEADVVWRLDMMSALGVRPHNLSTCTIAVWRDRIFAVTGNGVDETHTPPLADAPSFIAVDKKTGKLLWQDDSPGQNVLHGQWGSPVVAELAGKTQVIFPGGDGWLYSFDPWGTSDGKGELIWKFDCNPKESVWKFSGASTRNNLLHAPTVHQGLLYVAMGRDPEHGTGPGRVWCIDPSGSGDVSPELVFGGSLSKRPIAHKREQACEPDRGDYTSPNPNSKVVWCFQQDDVNGNGKFEDEERMSRSLSTISIKRDLLFVSDTFGILHCLPCPR